MVSCERNGRVAVFYANPGGIKEDRGLIACRANQGAEQSAAVLCCCTVALLWSNYATLFYLL